MYEKAKGTPRRTQRYSPELMQRALSLLAAGERPSYISTLLGVPFSTISTWKKGNPTRIQNLAKKQKERYEIAITDNLCEDKLGREKTADTLLSVAFNRAAELLETTRDLDKVTRFIETMSKLKTPENNTASNFEQLYVSHTKLSQNVKTKYIDVEEVK